MNRIVLLLLFSGLICQHARSNAAAPLSENLNPLKTFLGNWDICWTDSNGRHRTGKASVRLEAGGAVVIFEAQILDQNAKTIFSLVSLFYWDKESNAIVESSFDSSGWHGSSTLAEIKPKKFVLEGHGNRGPGTDDCSSTQFEKLCRDRWSLHFTRQLGGGTSSSLALASSKLTFTRAN